VTDSSSAGQGKPAIDSSVAHSARVWNYWLGGKDNYLVDREAGEPSPFADPGDVPALCGVGRKT
jgi:S-adenosyl methyltransferase